MVGFVDGNFLAYDLVGSKVSNSGYSSSSFATASHGHTYLDATSSIQTQLNAKAPLASPTFTGTVTSPYFIPTTNYKSVDGTVGATGSFTTVDGKTVTVKNGLVTLIAVN
ncbi:MAG: hypothetical protein WC974_09680, partial [Thermoplasmata archaeon]